MVKLSLKTRTLKVRVKDKHAKQLGEMARSVNVVWNYINELSSRSIKERGRFLSAYDLHPYTRGAGKALGLHSQCLQCVAAEYVTRRNQFKRPRLRWRVSGGAKRSLGWIPINTKAASWKHGQIFHHGQYYQVWDSYGLSGYTFRSASFNEDARGRWYFNVVVDYEPSPGKGTASVGIDLGCKDAATVSTGEKLSGRWYRELEGRLAVAQRAGKQHRARAIQAKVKNRRQDALHKFSRDLVDKNAAIFVGNVNAKAVARTTMGKSSLDAGWGMLKSMLEYKCNHAGVVFEEINESYTSQTCSSCGSLPESRPKGIAGLGHFCKNREWTCSECGDTHDRDINAAMNILALGHERLAVGIPSVQGGEDVKCTRMMRSPSR